MTFPRYPAYKDSGVAWLEAVPAHWEVRQLGRLGSFSKGGGGTKEDAVEAGVPCVRYGDLYTQYRFFIERTKTCVSPEKALAYTPIHYGDVLFAGSGETIEEIGKSAVNLLTEPACCGGDVILFRPSISVDAKFFGYATDCPQATFQKACMGRGFTVMHIYASELKYLSVVLPPLAEQRTIAAFLDAETARIDTLVAKQTALIATLQEKRRALISHVVTKGLDSAAPMKDSGVPWLGAVPQHWEVKRFRRCCDITEGQVDPKDERFNERILIAPNHIESGTGRILYTETAIEQGAISGKYLVKSGEVIYSKIRPALNKVCLSQGDWLCSADMYPIQTRPDLMNEYLFYFLLSDPFVSLMIEESMRVAMPKINRETLTDCPIPVPPIDEQTVAVTYIVQETAQIDTLIAKAEEMSGLLREHRVALIAAAVTGQIDVRGWDCPHPLSPSPVPGEGGR